MVARQGLTPFPKQGNEDAEKKRLNQGDRSAGTLLPGSHRAPKPHVRLGKAGRLSASGGGQRRKWEVPELPQTRWQKPSGWPEDASRSRNNAHRLPWRPDTCRRHGTQCGEPCRCLSQLHLPLPDPVFLGLALRGPEAETPKQCVLTVPWALTAVIPKDGWAGVSHFPTRLKWAPQWEMPYLDVTMWQVCASTGDVNLLTPRSLLRDSACPAHSSLPLISTTFSFAFYFRLSGHLVILWQLPIFLSCGKMWHPLL